MKLVPRKWRWCSNDLVKCPKVRNANGHRAAMTDEQSPSKQPSFWHSSISFQIDSKNTAVAKNIWRTNYSICAENFDRLWWLIKQIPPKLAAKIQNLKVSGKSVSTELADKAFGGIQYAVFGPRGQLIRAEIACWNSQNIYIRISHDRRVR